MYLYKIKNNYSGLTKSPIKLIIKCKPEVEATQMFINEMY